MTTTPTPSEAIMPPSDADFCRYLDAAKTIRNCVFLVLEGDRWWPTEESRAPHESDNGEYYEFFPGGVLIQRREIRTGRLQEELRWSDIVTRSPALMDWPWHDRERPASRQV